jgi:transcriptional regulator with XRE-family HTH domain
MYGANTDSEFARAIGISPSTLSRWLIAAPSHPPGTDVCLRIAHLTQVSPAGVLRAAGKDEVAELLDALYGLSVEAAAARIRRRGPLRLTSPEQRLIVELRALSPAVRRLALRVVQQFARQGS